jgi:hypothetical protein
MEAVEKQNYVFPPLPQRLENSPKACEFSTVPTVTTTGFIQTGKSKNPLIALYQL